MSRRRRRRKSWISGILNVNKPSGMTSHDVVAAIRRASNEPKVGHAGTLDPLATGVLLVCLGKATRLSEYLMVGEKRYTATLQLGTTTDTYDSQGTILSQADVPEFTAEEIERHLAPFIGAQEQLPPMHSAIKRDGIPLYKLARQGIEVERPLRPVTIHEIRVLQWTSPLLTLDVRCSKGTYIRSLAHDVGQAMGCGAHLAALTRTASGDFVVETASELEPLLASWTDSSYAEHLIPPDRALSHHPACHLDDEQLRRVQLGQEVAPDNWSAEAKPDQRIVCRAYDRQGRFIALLRPLSEPGRWQPDKVFIID